MNVVNAGSEQSETFEALAVPLLRPLYNFAHWLTQDHHQAEDLVQETYARAIKGLASFRPGTNFRAWMFRILRNTFITSRTRAGFGQEVSVDEEVGEMALPAVTDNPESVLLGTQRQQQIQAALDRLPLAYREVILLCDMEEMRYQEIAELLGVPIGTVMSRIARGRKLLRGMLAEERLRR